LESVRIGYEADDETNLAVEDVSLEVWAGEKVMLLGPPVAASPLSSRR
jgi:ABC-type microcin C transport system duplicated ATPase subunit YejF